MFSPGPPPLVDPPPFIPPPVGATNGGESTFYGAFPGFGGDNGNGRGQKLVLDHSTQSASALTLLYSSIISA